MPVADADLASVRRDEHARINADDHDRMNGPMAFLTDNRRVAGAPIYEPHAARVVARKPHGVAGL